MKRRKERRESVLEAANRRFEQYGFNKTTMAEIAKDSGMSAGNLYRFFSSKDDIITEIARGCFEERLKKLRDMFISPPKTVSSMLESFVLINLRHSHEMFSKQKHIFELVEFISRERKELLNKHLNDLVNVIKELLESGKKTGEFRVNDIELDSRAIFNAIHKFIAPHFMGESTLDEMEREAREVISLLIRGLHLKQLHLKQGKS